MVDVLAAKLDMKKVYQTVENLVAEMVGMMAA